MDASDMELEFGFSIVGYEAQGSLHASNKKLADTYSLRVTGNFPHTGDLRVSKIQGTVAMTDEWPRILVVESSGYIYLPPAEYMNSRRQAPVWRLSPDVTIPLIPTHYRGYGTALSWPSQMQSKVWLSTAEYLNYQIRQWQL